MSETEIDTTYALYLFAGIFFVLSVIYFGAEVIFQLSPVTKSLLLLSLTDLIILTGIYVSGRIKSLIAYLIGFISYIIFLVHGLAVFEPSTEVTLAFLMASAVAFASLGKLVDDGKLYVDSKRFRVISILLIIASAGITAADLTGPPVDYRISLEENVEIQEGSNRIGELTAVNDYYLIRSYKIPDHRACAFDPDRKKIDVRTADYRRDSGNIDGMAAKSFNMTVDSRAVPDETVEQPSDRRPIRGEFAIERSDGCPKEGENGTIYVFKDEEDNGFD